MPKVSIITPSFNREDYVSQTLDSLLEQTYTDWENIIVDDGSTDSTTKIIQDYTIKDNRIKLFNRSKNPKGACTCRNEGVDYSAGEYLIFLDTDDLLTPFCLEQRVKAMQDNPELDFGIFPSLMFRHNPYDLGLWWNIDKETDELTRQFRQDAICQGTGVIWRKASFNRIGRWDTSLYLWQDIDLFLRAYIQDYKYRKFFHLPPDLHNRCLESSLSRGNFFDPKKTESRIRVLRNAVDMLKKFGKSEYLKEASYMTAEIISGLSRYGSYKTANDMITWGKQENILLGKDVSDLKQMVLFRKLKLYKIGMFANKIQSIEKSFSVDDCTLGILPYGISNPVSTQSGI